MKVALKEIIIKLGIKEKYIIPELEGMSMPELLFWLKTERLAWVIVRPCNGRYFQSDLFYKWSSQGDWLQYPVAHSRKNLFTTEEECLVEALEHLITLNFFKQYI